MDKQPVSTPAFFIGFLVTIILSSLFGFGLGTLFVGVLVLLLGSDIHNRLFLRR